MNTDTFLTDAMTTGMEQPNAMPLGTYSTFAATGIKMLSKKTLMPFISRNRWAHCWKALTGRLPDKETIRIKGETEISPTFEDKLVAAGLIASIMQKCDISCNDKCGIELSKMLMNMKSEFEMYTNHKVPTEKFLQSANKCFTAVIHTTKAKKHGTALPEYTYNIDKSRKFYGCEVSAEDIVIAEKKIAGLAAAFKMRYADQKQVAEIEQNEWDDWTDEHKVAEIEL